MSEEKVPEQRKSLVVVVGAGASHEVGLPLGTKLKGKIADALNFHFDDFGRRKEGSPGIYGALTTALQETAEDFGDINSLVAAAREISAAMPQARSIDDFLDSRRGNRAIELCGKLAIVECILGEEATSHLWVDPRNTYNTIDFAKTSETWLPSFFQLLRESCRSEDLADRFKRVAVVSFNYDRSLEHYLYFALRNYYNMPVRDAGKLAASLEIYHPYGRVGALPSMEQPPLVSFGGKLRETGYLRVAKQIKPFTEGMDPEDSNIKRIRTVVAGAKQLVFLGFAFHPLNLKLLFSQEPLKEKLVPTFERVFGTAYGMSASDAKDIRAEIGELAKLKEEQVQIQERLTCHGLFHEFGRSLSRSLR